MFAEEAAMTQSLRQIGDGWLQKASCMGHGPD